MDKICQTGKGKVEALAMVEVVRVMEVVDLDMEGLARTQIKEVSRLSSTLVRTKRKANREPMTLTPSSKASQTSRRWSSVQPSCSVPSAKLNL